MEKKVQVCKSTRICYGHRPRNDETIRKSIPLLVVVREDMAKGFLGQCLFAILSRKDYPL